MEAEEAAEEAAAVRRRCTVRATAGTDLDARRAACSRTGGEAEDRMHLRVHRHELAVPARTTPAPVAS
jgi:hypothetical protein